MPCDNAKTSSDIEHVDWSTGTGSGHHYSNVRFGSGSSQASQSSGDICRICHCESDPQNPLLTPCYCAGSLKYVHQACLQQWLTASETNSCELCKFPFIMHTKIKPFNEWRSLDISGIERRRLCCSVLFHCAAALCVIWSLCVLIERAADDVQRGLIDWPFWTKLAVVTVGLTGGLVFMYIQCKAYVHLCHRWKARNRILLIQNAPEKVHQLSPSPVVQHRSRHESSSEPRTSAGGANVAVSRTVELAANVPGTVANVYHHYGHMTADGTAGNMVEVDHLSSVPHQLLQQAELNINPLVPRSCGSGGGHYQQQPSLGVGVQQMGQVAVSANIECSQSQHNYERDWALDDVVSQISSFRPCPQGSGSMTPFHDSIHNALEHSQSSSGSMNEGCSGSRQDLSTGGISCDTGRENALQLSSFSGSGEQKAPSISSGVSNAVANGLGSFVYKPHTKRYSNSSIFLENRDILNDSVSLGLESTDDFPSINYRHSSTLTSPHCVVGAELGRGDGDVLVGTNDDRLEKFLGEDLHRYSDTKLLVSDPEAHMPMLIDTATETPLCSEGELHSGHTQRLLKQHSAAVAADTVLDMELPTSPLSPPAIIIGQRGRHAGAANAMVRRSMNTVEDVQEQRVGGRASSPAAQQQIDKARLFFKSLPNLSSSCESLIKK